MSALVAASPFDALRRVGADGSEHWSARDLMPVMTYPTWQHFRPVIERAMEAAGEVAANHFTVNREKGLGRPREDFTLTRFGAYLVAMNGDPAKKEVAAAQRYFAVKTHEAEVAPVAAASLTRRDLALLLIEAEDELDAAKERAELAEAQVADAAPAVEYVERYVSSDDAITAKTWGAQYGLTQPQAFGLLVEKGIIRRHDVGSRWSNTKGRMEQEHEYRAVAGRVTFEHFTLRPQHNAPRLHNGQVRQTLYIRQQYALELAIRAGLATRRALTVVGA